MTIYRWICYCCAFVFERESTLPDFKHTSLIEQHQTTNPLILLENCSPTTRIWKFYFTNWFIVPLIQQVSLVSKQAYMTTNNKKNKRAIYLPEAQILYGIIVTHPYNKLIQVTPLNFPQRAQLQEKNYAPPHVVQFQ